MSCLSGVVRANASPWKMILRMFSLSRISCVLGSGKDSLQLRVVPGSQKGERCSERAGADSGNYLEIRACTRCGPAIQDPRTESAAGAAAGQGKSVIDRIAAIIQREGPGRFLFYRGDYVGLEIRVELAGLPLSRARSRPANSDCTR